MSFLPGQFAHPYEINPSYRTSDAYFSMECGIEFEVTVHDHPVLVRALYLPAEIFGTAPLFLLTTDVEGNDHMSRSISQRLYAHNDSIQEQLSQNHRFRCSSAIASRAGVSSNHFGLTRPGYPHANSLSCKLFTNHPVIIYVAAFF